MATRRDFLKAGTIGGSGLYLASKFGFIQRAFTQAVPGGNLDPYAIPRFVTPLFVPPAMPPTSTAGAVDYYEVAARQIRQQILPGGMPNTTVWAYGSVNHAGTFHSPAPTFEARVGRVARVKWINDLVDRNGNFRPHLLPIDQTLHWANPPGPRDGMGMNPAPYTGPVPLVAHLHGGHTLDDSDGYPEAWYLPAAGNIPAGYATEGSWYNFFRKKAAGRLPAPWAPGTATFDYSNDQAATTLWAHDHTLGITRANVHAGLAAFYLLRGDALDTSLRGLMPGPAPVVGDASSANYYEIPIVIQDRSFNADGSLFFPSDRAFFEGVSTADLQIPFIPNATCDGRPSDVSPIWNPEYFGNTMMVNGNTWPFLEVEQRRYRFRLLNGCNARTLLLKLDRDTLPLWQIGSDGGFLSRPAQLTQLLMAPAERADIIVDFTRVPVGTTITLQNIGPDSPFGGGVSGVDYPPADPQTTGAVMQFRVRPARSVDRSVQPGGLKLTSAAAQTAVGKLRRVSLNELDSSTVSVVGNPDGTFAVPIRQAPCGDPNAVPFGPSIGLLGTVNKDGSGNPLAWMDPLSENPSVGTELWEIRNFTADAHPIHIHQTQFRVLDRAPFDPENPSAPAGPARGPEAWETGAKDTVIAYPGEITRLVAKFDLNGQYVWHCHILDHEDHDMMRPMAIGKPQNPHG
ncbi:MAG: multicopper oxidase domain-containing protein [Acidobacteria bacterium]|nr:multicopper oxidase domain-containing protein [Acidobacteriota bacterium]